MNSLRFFAMSCVRLAIRAIRLGDLLLKKTFRVRCDMVRRQARDQARATAQVELGHSRRRVLIPVRSAFESLERSTILSILVRHAQQGHVRLPLHASAAHRGVLYFLRYSQRFPQMRVLRSIAGSRRLSPKAWRRWHPSERLQNPTSFHICGQSRE